MAPFNVYMGPSGIVVEGDVVEMNKLIEWVAACVLFALDYYPIDGSDPTGGPGKVLVGRMNWASHGFTNALLTQVNWLYGIVEVVVDAKGCAPALFNSVATVDLVIDALSAFQKWKEANCRKMQEKYGPEWGIATDLYKKDWTDKCDEFRKAML